MYSGSCHCGSIKFECLAPLHLVTWNCNCSICQMKKNWHFIIPTCDFKLLSNPELVTEYRFNTMKAVHKFCSKCGVQAFYIPRSNPDGVAVTLACISLEQIESYEIVNFDGLNWESFFRVSNISKYSQA
eukprot:gene16664-22785_t